MLAQKSILLAQSFMEKKLILAELYDPGPCLLDSNLKTSKKKIKFNSVIKWHLRAFKIV